MILLPPDSEDQNVGTDAEDEGELVEPVDEIEVVFDKDDVEDEWFSNKTNEECRWRKSFTRAFSSSVEEEVVDSLPEQYPAMLDTSPVDI